jgi:putative transposase
MDLVGPRYIKDDGRFYSMNVIDLFCREVYIEAQRTKEDSHVCQGLLRCWKTMGIPDYLQLDNALNFRGSNRYPRSFGQVIRLCLSYGVHPVFIPIGEPWRNGVVENFNNTYDKKFFRRQWFASYAVLKQQSRNFQRFHNKHHRHSFLKGKTPQEVKQANEFSPVTAGKNAKMPDLSFIPDGYISVIRFIRSDRMLDIFGERFEVAKNLAYSYVRALVITQLHIVQLYLGDEIVDTFEYRIPNDL